MAAQGFKVWLSSIAKHNSGQLYMVLYTKHCFFCLPNVISWQTNSTNVADRLSFIVNITERTNQTDSFLFSVYKLLKFLSLWLFYVFIHNCSWYLQLIHVGEHPGLMQQKLSKRSNIGLPRYRVLEECLQYHE